MPAATPPDPSKEPRELTDDEKHVIDLTGDLFRAFAALPQYHPSDMDDLFGHVHAVQRIVMGRVVYRTNPEKFQPKQAS